jgi:hypothetical protein
VGGRYLRNGRYRPKADFGEKIPPAARFECATYALEEFVAAEKSIFFNSLHAKNGTV